jgi:hypothetical protein
MVSLFNCSKMVPALYDNVLELLYNHYSLKEMAIIKNKSQKQQREGTETKIK